MFNDILSYKLKNSHIEGHLSLITYVFYQKICSVHQWHHLQFRSWTAHQRMIGHISSDINFLCSKRCSNLSGVPNS